MFTIVTAVLFTPTPGRQTRLFGPLLANRANHEAFAAGHGLGDLAPWWQELPRGTRLEELVLHFRRKLAKIRIGELPNYRSGRSRTTAAMLVARRI